MFSIMDFLPTFAHIVGSKLPTDRAIDGVDQTDVLLGNSATGHRESLLSFIGGELVAVRWKQWRTYFTDVHPTGIGPQRQPGIFSASAQMAGYPKVYNIEMDPHEDLVVAGLFGWVSGPALKVVEEYLASVKKYPKPASAEHHPVWSALIKDKHGPTRPTAFPLMFRVIGCLPYTDGGDGRAAGVR